MNCICTMFAFMNYGYFNAVRVVVIFCLIHQALAVLCSVKCGVVETGPTNGDPELLLFLQKVWSDVQHTRKLYDVTFSFRHLAYLAQMDWDTFVEAYMEIGRENVTAIFGTHVQPLVTSAARYEIPYFLLRPTQLLQPQHSPSNVVRVFPEPLQVFNIAADVITKYKFLSVAVFYEDSFGTELIEELVNRPDLRVRAYKLHHNLSSERIRRLLVSVRQLAVTEIVLAASRDIILTVLNQALMSSMLTYRFQWIIPTLELETSELEQYIHTEVNITGFQLQEGQETIQTRPFPLSYTQFDYATIFDSLLTLHEAIFINYQNTGQCHWSGQNALQHTLSLIDEDGMTGRLQFDLNGNRHGYVIKVMGFHSEQLTEIGEWNSSLPQEHRLSFHSFAADPPYHSAEAKLEFPLSKGIIKVATVLESPFVSYVSDHEHKQGNDRFQGYCVDLMELLAQELGVAYEFYVVADGHFGSPQEDGTCNGLVGELMNGTMALKDFFANTKHRSYLTYFGSRTDLHYHNGNSHNASLAIASLTITSQREEVIDFSKPFRPRSITVMMKRTENRASFFQLLDPLSEVVWAMLAAVLVAVSLSFYGVDRLCRPAPHCRLSECVWFTFASLLRNGVDVTPRSGAGKVLAAILWFFSLIIISTYTANLAAFLTVSKFDTPVQSVFDLAGQGRVTYGTVWHSASAAFFQYNRLSYFQDMWQYMSSINPRAMAQSNIEGITRVKQSQGDYAFIWDADVIRHEVNQDCSLVEVGQAFDNAKGYGVGAPRGATYIDDISLAILRLNERGTLLELQDKWWEPSSCPNQNGKKPAITGRALSLDSISGVFVVLCLGIVLAFTVGLLHFLLRKVHHKKHKEHQLPKIANKENNSLSVPCSNQFRLENTDAREPLDQTEVEVPFIPRRSFRGRPSSKHTNIF